jgi:hypothetical protein
METLDPVLTGRVGLMREVEAMCEHRVCYSVHEMGAKYGGKVCWSVRPRLSSAKLSKNESFYNPITDQPRGLVVRVSDC